MLLSLWLNCNHIDALDFLGLNSNYNANIPLNVSLHLFKWSVEIAIIKIPKRFLEIVSLKVSICHSSKASELTTHKFFILVHFQNKILIQFYYQWVVKLLRPKLLCVFIRDTTTANSKGIKHIWEQICVIPSVLLFSNTRQIEGSLELGIGLAKGTNFWVMKADIVGNCILTQKCLLRHQTQDFGLTC